MWVTYVILTRMVTLTTLSVVKVIMSHPHLKNSKFYTNILLTPKFIMCTYRKK